MHPTRHAAGPLARSVASPLLLATLALAACGGGDDGSGPSPGPSGDRLTTLPGAAVSKRIGPAGDSIAVTAPGGLRYVLVVPPEALDDETTITVTPVTAFRDFPLSGGHLAGVTFAPSGLQFRLPATLRITGLATPPAGQRLAAVGTDADGETPVRRVLSRLRGPAEIRVPHFSAVNVGTGTPAEVAALSVEDLFDGTYAALLDILTLAVDNGDRASALQALRDMITTVLVPALQGATTVSEREFAAIGATIFHFEAGDALRRLQGESLEDIQRTSLSLNLRVPVPAELQAAYDQLRAAAAPMLRALVAEYNEKCLRDRDIRAARDVFSLPVRNLALVTGTNTAAEQLDDATLATNLCVRVKVRRATLADPLPLNRDVTLDLQYELEFKDAGGSVNTTENYKVAITSEGPVTVAQPTGTTGPSTTPGPIVPGGFYTTGVRATGEGLVRLRARGCWLRFPSNTESSANGLLCEETLLERGAAALGVTVSPASVTLAPGQVQQFTASVTGVADQRVTWTATGGTITPDGRFTAGTTPGTFTVTARSVVETSASGSASVTVGEQGQVRFFFVDVGGTEGGSAQAAANTCACAGAEDFQEFDWPSSGGSGGGAVAAAVNTTQRVFLPDNSFVDVRVTSNVNVQASVTSSAGASGGTLTFSASTNMTTNLDPALAGVGVSGIGTAGVSEALRMEITGRPMRYQATFTCTISAPSSNGNGDWSIRTAGFIVDGTGCAASATREGTLQPGVYRIQAGMNASASGANGVSSGSVNLVLTLTPAP